MVIDRYWLPYVYVWRLHVAVTLFCLEFIYYYVMCILTILLLRGKTTTWFESSSNSCVATQLIGIILCSLVYINNRQKLMEDHSIEGKFQIVMIAKGFKGGLPKVIYNYYTNSSFNVHRVIVCICKYPLIGLRRITYRIRISHEIVKRRIHEKGLHSYKVYHVQKVCKMDYVTRRKFYHLVLRTLNAIHAVLKISCFRMREFLSSATFAIIRIPKFRSIEILTLWHRVFWTGLIYSIYDVNM